MDSAQVVELARLISEQGFEPSWKFYVIQLGIIVLSLIGGAFLNAYAAKRGEIAANRDQFAEIKAQLRETTELSEQIRSAVSFEEWSLKDKRDLRRRKLEQLCLAAYSSYEWLTAYRELAIKSGTGGEAITGRDELSTSIHTVVVVGGLYFPELRTEIGAFSSRHQTHVARLSQLGLDLLSAKHAMAANPPPADLKTPAQVLAEARPQLLQQLREIYIDLVKLNGTAQSLMDTIARERPA